MNVIPRPDSPPAGATLSRKRRVLFWTLLLGGTYLTLELMSLGAISFFFGGWSSAQMAMEGAAGQDALATGFEYPDEIVHPYFGWVRRPKSTIAGPGREPPANDFGFTDREQPIQTRSPDQVIIGIVGGSVAQQFGSDASEVLKAELMKSADFDGKSVVFVQLSLSGYKQPQQLLIVNYLLTLGAQFDILINIDGYNEIVLPVVENADNHVFDAFPRSWNLRVTEVGNLAAMRAIGKIALLKDQTKAWAEVVRSRPWCYSATANLAWRVYHAHVRRLMFREYSDLHAIKHSEWDYAANGPPQRFADEAGLYEHCARIWMRSSLQLHQLCSANGIRYFHFLQPNQYVPGSKSMGADEKTAAWFPGDPGKKPVEKGYPLLIREGRSLTDQGVAFFDLTKLFADHPEATYKDPCCHLNDRGNELLAKVIADAIRRSARAP